MQNKYVYLQIFIILFLLSVIERAVHAQVLIWTPDNLSQSSAQRIQSALNANGVSASILSDISSTNLDNYASIFICLGIYPDNFVLEDGEDIDNLVDYLNAGGRLYMEGGDTWARDYPTDLHAFFNLLGEADGDADLSTLIGHACFDDYRFDYTGSQRYIDHLAPLDGATLVFSNTQPGYGAAVAYDHGQYRTLALSFEFGGLADGDNSTDELMGDILAFFDDGCAGGAPAPLTVQAVSGYDHAVPLMWDAPVGQTTLSIKEEQSAPMIFSHHQRNNDGRVKKPNDRAVAAPSSLAKTNLYQTQSYNIYRSASSDGPYEKIAANVERQYYRDTAVANANTYYYVITANYSSGESAYSEQTSATPEAHGFRLTSAWTTDYVTIDGSLAAGEWDGATVYNIAQSDDQPVWLYLMNNDDYLYLAVDDAANHTAVPDDQVGVYMDRDRNGEWSDEPLEGNYWFSWSDNATTNLFRELRGWWPAQIRWDDPETSATVIGTAAVNGHLQYELRFPLDDFDLPPDQTVPIHSFIYSLDMPDSLYRGVWPATVMHSAWSTAWMASVLYGAIEISGEVSCPFLAHSQYVNSAGLYAFNSETSDHDVEIMVHEVTGDGMIKVSEYDCVYPDLPGADPLALYWKIIIDENLEEIKSDYIFHYTDEDFVDVVESADYVGIAWFDAVANAWKWKGGELDDVNNTVTLHECSDAGVFVLYRRLFGDSTGDGYVGAADLQEFGDVWLHTSATEFPSGSNARFHNYNKNERDGEQIIDAGDLQVFGDNWLNGSAP